MIGEARTAILDLVSSLTDIPCVWDGSAEPVIFGSRRALGRLAMKSATALGVDDVRRTFNAITEGVDVEYTGLRTFTLSVNIESYQDSEAYELCEALRLRMRRESSRALLAEAGISYIDSLSCTELNLIRNTQVVSNAVVDFRLAMAVSDIELALPGMGWIEECEPEWEAPE